MEIKYDYYEFSKSPKLSIIVPVREGGDYSITLNSLKNQTYQDFNVIVIFDTFKKGANYTRNIGWVASKKIKRTKYVMFCDDDIDWKDYALESMVGLLETNKNISYAYGSYEMDGLIHCHKQFDVNELKKANFISTMSVIRSKDFPGFDNDIKRLQDWDVWLCMLFQGKVGGYTGKLIFTTKKKQGGITFGGSISYEKARDIIYKKYGLLKKETKKNYIENQGSKIECVIVLKHDRNPFMPVQKMILENFDNELDTVVVLGYNDKTFNIQDFKLKHPGKKIIIYQLEQLYECKSEWYNPYSSNPLVVQRTNHIKYCLENCDEIWDYDLNNIEFLKKNGFNNIKHVPMKYTESLRRSNPNTEYDYDILFFGAVNERRAKYLSILNKKYRLKIVTHECYRKMFEKSDFYGVTVASAWGDKLWNDYIFKSKIVINLHYYDSCLQEQVRIFELLINNKVVISEKSLRNYFGNLVPEFTNEKQMIDKIETALRYIDVSEKYRTL